MRSDGEETRSRIVKAAEIVFAEKGFREATNQDIAREAGANGASISYYFRDKAGLYLQVWQETQKRSRSIYSEWLEEETRTSSETGGISSRSELLERLKRIMRCIYDWACDEESRDSSILFDEMAQETGLLVDFRKDMVLHPLSVGMENVLEALLSPANKGELQHKLLTHIYLSSIRCHFGRNEPGMNTSLSADELFERFWELILEHVEAVGNKAAPPAKKGKPAPSSPQMELGVTDEVAFELKHPTREEIVLQEERMKAKLAEAAEMNRLEEEPIISQPICHEEQMELFRRDL